MGDGPTTPVSSSQGGDEATRLVTVAQRSDAAEPLIAWAAGRQVFVITSSPVWRLHGDAILGELRESASGFEVVEVPDGETAKNLAVAEMVWRRMLESGGRRDSRVVTLGGGSVCDLGAFVAGTFMRGVEFSHVPTTLLAQVDAAIGGKSAINLAGGKNMVGLFRQPAQVIAAVEALATLSVRQVRSGLVEVIKVAALCNASLFEMLERYREELAAGSVRGDNEDVWIQVIDHAQRTKADVVDRDPREGDERRVLNFGHTLGHALESALEYSTLTHGEAVAYGMLFALQLAASRSLDDDLQARLEALLASLELPPLPALEVEPLAAAIDRDKKAGPDGAVWILPRGLARWEAVSFDRQWVGDELASFLAHHSGAC